ncbi:hypothetical protein [Micromonospora viridifaciens]|nr:hypothetical protein [Micromonospora viridifaciens]
MVAMVVMSGCDDGEKSAVSDVSNAAPATPTNSPTATETGAPTMDAATKSACTSIKSDIQAALKRVAAAEKIGPPAGHSAVSAEYSADAAMLYAHAFTSSTAVNDAVKQVADAMSELADAWATAPKKAPSAAPLTAAMKQLDTACSVT